MKVQYMTTRCEIINKDMRMHHRIFYIGIWLQISIAEHESMFNGFCNMGLSPKI